MTIERTDPRGRRGPLPDACEDAFCTSGPSPTLHVLGAGPVGRALLDLVGDESFKLSPSAIDREPCSTRLASTLLAFVM